MFYFEDNMASTSEILKAFDEEMKSWTEEEVFESIFISAVPKESNIISPHVIYRWKEKEIPQQRLKARIVPHGYRDVEKQNMRTDSPSMKPEVMRVICAFAIDMGFELRAMDVKTACLWSSRRANQVAQAFSTYSANIWT